MDVLVVDHPLVKARLSTMRDARTDNATFRAALRDLTLMLVYEALRTAPLRTSPIHTPVARTLCYSLAQPPLLVPVLRAGLGMVDAAQAFVPESQVGFVGMARDEETHQPCRTWCRCPSRWRAPGVRARPDARHRRVDGPHDRAARRARGRGRHGRVRAGRAEGIARLRGSGLSVRLVTASVDERLNDSAYIVPGLGDAGDRQFGSV